MAGDIPLESENKSAPYPLILGLQCRQFNALLVPGGILDQPVVALAMVSEALAAYDSVQASRQQAEMQTFKSQLRGNGNQRSWM